MINGFNQGRTKWRNWVFSFSFKFFIWICIRIRLEKIRLVFRQKLAHSLSAQMAILSSSFSVFIVLGVDNFGVDSNWQGREHCKTFFLLIIAASVVDHVQKHCGGSCEAV